MSTFARYKAFVTYFFFSVATSALGFITAIVLMRLIPPSEFGRIAIFVSLQFLVAPVISVAAEGLIGVNRAKCGSASYEHFRRSYVTMAYVIFFSLQIIFLMFYAFGVYNDSLFLLIPVVSLLKFLINIASIEYVMEEKSVLYGSVQLLTAVLSLLLTVVLLVSITATADLRIVALLMADVVFLYVRYMRKMQLLLNVIFDVQQWRQVIRFGLPLLVAVVPAWFLNEADKMIVAKFADMSSVGLYAAACAVGGFMVTFNTSLLNAILPKLYVALDAKSQSFLAITKRFMLEYIFISVAFAIFFAAIYGLLADVILPEKYTAARSIVYWVILFALSRSFYAILGAVIDYFGMTIQKLKGISIGAVAALLSMFIGISQFGIAGVVVGVGVGYSVLSILLWLSLVNRSRLGLFTK